MALSFRKWFGPTRLGGKVAFWRNINGLYPASFFACCFLFRNVFGAWQKNLDEVLGCRCDVGRTLWFFPAYGWKNLFGDVNMAMNRLIFTLVLLMVQGVAFGAG